MLHQKLIAGELPWPLSLHGQAPCDCDGWPKDEKEK